MMMMMPLAIGRAGQEKQAGEQRVCSKVREKTKCARET